APFPFSDTGLCFRLSLLSGCGSTAPPEVHLLVPTCEESSTESQLELVCLLLSFKPDQANVKWLVRGKESSPPTPAFSSAMGSTLQTYFMSQTMHILQRTFNRGRCPLVPGLQSVWASWLRFLKRLKLSPSPSACSGSWGTHALTDLGRRWV
uniref:Immunoglobulin C1-set domain-containing protein n=1 Tax=Gopherus agassizii TaxID=38772 RepID=A0A452GLJ2_9SAUR